MGHLSKLALSHGGVILPSFYYTVQKYFVLRFYVGVCVGECVSVCIYAWFYLVFFLCERL